MDPDEEQGPTRVVVGISGASGSRYGVRVLEVLASKPDVEVHLVVTSAGRVVINTGMTMGLTPITGITLPFVSYGGSSMLVNYLLIGLLISVSQNRPFSVARRPFETPGAQHASVG